MRKLVYYVATTVDRYIARKDGSWDWALFEGPHYRDLIERYPETFPTHGRPMFGITAPNREFDTVLMGRATYEPALAHGITSPYAHLRQYVFSRSMTQSPDPAVTLVRDEAAETVRALKREAGGKDIWLCGGGALAAALYDEIDELVLKVNPVIIGEGIPMFDGPVRQRSVVLKESRAYENGFLLARYAMSS